MERSQISPREKRILLLRFFGNMTESLIAREVGVSQMHVFRLLARSLAQLREKLLVEEQTAAAGRVPSRAAAVEASEGECLLVFQRLVSSGRFSVWVVVVGSGEVGGGED